MIRSIAAIVCAILQSQPTMDKSIAEQYAKIVQTEARDHHFDPYTLVSMAHYESHWQSGAGNGTCFGLVGVCVSNYKECQQDRHGLACMEKQKQLLSGPYNLRVAADHITANRRFCRGKTGRAGFRHWLASYQGINSPSKGIWCGQRKVKGVWIDVPVHRITGRVMSRRRHLMRTCK